MSSATTLLPDLSNIGIHPTAYRLPATARIGKVRLAVSEMERSVDFYTRVIGLEWAAGSPVAATTGARLLFWELVLPTLADVEKAAASLALIGYMSTSPEPNVRSVTDPWGITLRLMTSQ